jgi:hypothetical protein
MALYERVFLSSEGERGMLTLPQAVVRDCYGVFRTFQITAPDKPVLCQDKERLYVCVPLHPESVLTPQSPAVRTPLPALARKNESRIASAPQPKLPASSAAPTAAPVNSVRMFGGFLNCARDLWTLVRKHHREESTK